MSSKLDQALDDAIKERRSDHRSNNSQQRRRQSSSTSSSSRHDRRNTSGGGIRKRISGGGGFSSNINSRLGGGRGREQNVGGGPQRHNRRSGLKRSTDQPWSHDLFSGNGGGNLPIEARLGGGRQQHQRRGGNKYGESSRSGTTLTVENLHYNVTEEDLASVFKLVGTVDKCKIEFDRSGRSTGTAKIVFPDQDVAQKALDKFNNVDLDGQPMKITLLNKSSGGGHASSGRVSSGGRGGRGGSTRQSRSSRNEDDLDAELEAYSKSKDQDGDAMMTD
ncbi:hypothetical protein BCR42DRAFT_496984 [Absidia repens]|uniref:RRM domain-containing protein n=1 Tax=Absidia repens TaxID=90262 RepID=A0A1X2HXR3_9FUNG|nr:hypothetical protein BCR42DRAFT_496984 [Absidia repens]